MLPRLGALLTLAALVSPWAAARSTHVVRHGQTLGGIALEYRTTVRDLLAANPRLKRRALRAGETIVVPGADDAADPRHANGASGSKTAKGSKGGNGTTGAAKAPEKASRYAGKPKHPGVVHLSRLVGSEDAIVTVRDRAGKVPKAANPVFTRMLRAKSGATHAIDARLIALVGIVSDHFGGRRIEVISGYRPYSKHQHTAHSNHNIGHAIDFRVIGVPNEVVRDYCRTLRNVGVGYYPNSVFVHMDVRSEPAYWVDFSRPGEPPRYGEGGVDPDEGASDVGDDNPLVGKLVAEGEGDEPDKAAAPKGAPASGAKSSGVEPEDAPSAPASPVPEPPSAPSPVTVDGPAN
jgi:uncharacterized protein YcbK (DUF882 family)